MRDDTTENRKYPLPHPDNVLEDDAERIRQALSAIDGDMPDGSVLAALAAANDPNGENPFTTKADIPDSEPPLPPDIRAALTGAGAPGAENPYATKEDIPEIPDVPDSEPPLPPGIRAALIGAAAPGGENPYATIKDIPSLRQLDLAIPGRFAERATAGALLEAGKDYAVWQLEPSKLKIFMARAYAADSGATPASVFLSVNGAQAGGTLNVLASTWSELDLSPLDCTIEPSDRIEIGVSGTGANKDSDSLRVVIVAEVIGR